MTLRSNNSSKTAISNKVCDNRKTFALSPCKIETPWYIVEYFIVLRSIYITQYIVAQLIVEHCTINCENVYTRYN